MDNRTCLNILINAIVVILEPTDVRSVIFQSLVMSNFQMYMNYSEIDTTKPRSHLNLTLYIYISPFYRPNNINILITYKFSFVLNFHNFLHSLNIPEI